MHLIDKNYQYSIIDLLYRSYFYILIGLKSWDKSLSRNAIRAKNPLKFCEQAISH